MPHIKVNDINLYYTQTGNGPPLLFLHGNEEDHHTFDPLIELLSKDYTCYAIDSRNHGKSQMTETFHYQTMMEDVYSFIQEMMLKKVSIIGFSDGSIITMLLAIQYPELLHKIILLGPNLSPADFTPACTRYVTRLYKRDANPLYRMMLEEPNITEQQLQKIQAPTLIIGGENDLYISGTFEKIQHNIPNSDLLIMQNHNHSSYIFKNNLLYTKINGYLK